MAKKMDIDNVNAIVIAAKADALAAITSLQLAEDRAKAMNYYNGDMSEDMPSMDGRSSAVSSDVADTIDGLMPSLMDIFAGTDEVVRFEPVGPEDEEAAQQESDYVNHVFMQQNNGFRVLYEFLKDGLLAKVGIVKVWWEENEVEENETYYDLTDDQFGFIANAVMESDGQLEIVKHTVNEEEPSEAPNADDIATQSPRTHDVEVRSTKKLSQARVVGVPPEEFGIERGARSIQTANYCFHDVVTKTAADLIDEGYDEEQVNSITPYSGRTDVETLARDTVQEHFNASSGTSNPAARYIKITENYIRLDYEGSGRPCLYQIITGGDRGEILHKNGKPCITKFDRMPFAGASPVPVTHRFFGRSIADQTMDIQRIKTALLRGVLDNSYMVTNPRIEVAEANAGPNTLDDLLVARPNGIVRTKQAGGLLPFQTPPIGQYLMPVIGYMDSVREMRTGVTRQGQGVDADALQNQSATAVNQVFSASQARMKLIARVMAEGVRDMFALLHATIRKHGQAEQTVRIRNNWVKIDPRNWKTRDDLTINVGLGNGGRAEQFAQMMAIANVQKTMLEGGKTNLVDDAKLFATASEIAKLAGHKNIDRFFNDPTAKDPQTGQLLYPPPPPRPDPKIMAIQAKAQADQQHQQHSAMIEQVQAQADAAVEQIKANAQAALERQKAMFEAALQQAEHAMKEREFALSMASQQQKMMHDEQLHHHKMAESVVKVAGQVAAHEMKLEQAKAKAQKPKADA